MPGYLRQILSCSLILNLTIINNSFDTVSVSACDSFIWDGITYYLTGTYTNVYTDINGCDSVAILNLTINSSDTTNFSIVMCDSYIWNGVNYTSSGVYISSFRLGILNSETSNTT